MEIALVNRVRTRPSRGLAGICQGCGQPTVAKCGPKRVWHWSHSGRRVCDAWWENEGEWHRHWKSYFPIDFREKVMRAEDGEKHIADIRLPDGLVVELQHSTMPLDEMRSREAFYERMIWIVDAAPFLKNLHIYCGLPDPALSFTENLIVELPVPGWRSKFPREEMSYQYLRAHTRHPVARPGSLKPNIRSMRLEEDFSSTYRGHHMLYWKKARSVWLETTQRTFLDLGDGRVGRLMRWRPESDSPWCLKIRPKAALVDYLIRRSSGAPQ